MYLKLHYNHHLTYYLMGLAFQIAVVALEAQHAEALVEGGVASEGAVRRYFVVEEPWPSSPEPRSRVDG